MFNLLVRRFGNSMSFISNYG